MKENQVTNVRYTRSTNYGRTDEAQGEVTERCIIPTYIPKTNVKALDVSDLSKEDRQWLQQLFEQYKQYYQDAVKSLFTFEDWVEHTQNVDVTNKVKWRTFNQNNLEETDQFIPLSTLKSLVLRGFFFFRTINSDRLST